MASMIDFKNSIAQLSKQFGEEMQVLEKYLPGDVNTERRVQIRFRSQAKKWKTQRILKNRPDKVSYQTINRNLLQEVFRRYLAETGYDFPISNFKYQGQVMDVFAMINERVIEFAMVTDLNQFATQFDLLYRLGARPVNKHSALEGGKALPAFFFFVSPAGMLDPDDVPAHCGLIQAIIPTGLILPIFSITKAAPMLHSARIPPTTYKHIAGHLQRHNRSLMQRYERNLFTYLNINREDPEQSLFD